MNPTDVLFSRYIRARDGGCVLRSWTMPNGSGCWGPLTCAHLVKRRFHAVRWDPRNAVALCLGHHSWMEEHPLTWADWREDNADMRDLLHTAYHGSLPDEKLIRAELRRRLKGAA